MAAIEVVDDRYEDYRALDTPTLVADDFFNAACVLGRAGRGLARARPRGAARAHDDQRRGGRHAAGAATFWATRSRRSPGSPTLSRHAASCLKAGEFVLLGSVVETRWVEQGDLVEASIEGLGAAFAQFT